VEQLSEIKNILELIGFPEEGGKHFADAAAKWNDEKWDANNLLEKRLIKERTRRVGLGERTGRKMDADIRRVKELENIERLKTKRKRENSDTLKNSKRLKE
jgi:hypothetical protein